MKRKIFYPIALVAVLAFVLFACRKETIDIFVESVTLDMSAATLEVNGTLELIVTIEPEDAYNQFVNWTSTNTTVATVNEDGVVTAKAPGIAVIIVTTVDGGLTATCTVTVIKQVTGISLSPKILPLIAGNKETLTVVFTPNDASNKTVTWTSSNNTVATVDNNGTVTAVSAGTANITATTQDGTKSDYCVVTVENASVPVTSVTLNQSTASLTTGNTLPLTAAVYPLNATNKNVTWTSSDPTVATLNNIGLTTTVTAVSPGTTTITVTTADNNLVAACVVTVSAPVVPVTNISFDHLSLTFTAGGPGVDLTVIFDPLDASDQTITWQTSNSFIASIDPNGITCTITPATIVTVPSTATIIATTTNGKTAICNVTVNPLTVTSLALDNSTLTINGSETKPLKASISPNGANQNVTWTSSDPTVATVSGTGLTVEIIPVAPAIGYTADRTTTITVTTADGSHTKTCLVTVKYVDVSGLTLDKTTLVLDEGDIESLEATISPVNASIKTVRWGSSPIGVVSVSSTTGVVMAIASGSTTITATSDGNSLKTADCAVTVN